MQAAWEDSSSSPDHKALPRGAPDQRTPSRQATLLAAATPTSTEPIRPGRWASNGINLCEGRVGFGQRPVSDCSDALGVGPSRDFWDHTAIGSCSSSWDCTTEARTRCPSSTTATGSHRNWIQTPTPSWLSVRCLGKCFKACSISHHPSGYESNLDLEEIGANRDRS